MTALETGATDWRACPICRVTTLHQEEEEEGAATIWRCVECGHPTPEEGGDGDA